MKKLLLIGCLAICLQTTAQNNTATSSDYQRAESRLTYMTQQFVDHGRVIPNWLPGDKFWYRTLNASGSEFILIDLVKGTRGQAFDHQRLASALSAATGKTYTSTMLPFQSIAYADDLGSLSVRLGEKKWKCDLKTYAVTADETLRKKDPDNEILSPDGNLAAFIKDYNLLVRDVKTGTQTPLTKDGVQDFGYATDNAGWRGSDRPILRWSPDSKKIATFKQDQRNVGEMYLSTTNVGHPILKSWKYPLPGDKDIPMITRVVINVDEAKVITLKVPPDPHRASLSDDISSSGTFDDVDWSDDGSELAFLSTSRDHKNEKLRIASTVTGDVREILEETVKTQFESGQNAINWRYLPKTREIIWYSERDDWGHLYLYDAVTGKIKNQITKGNWVVTQLVKVDEKARMVYFMVDGSQPENPYFSQLYQVGFDGKNLKILTPEPGTHQIMWSPSKNYFIDTHSKPDVPSVSVSRDSNGKKIMDLEKMDVSRLAATGWRAATPITLKAHDGKTDIYGLMFTPSQLDPNKKYPLVDYIYPGPQGGSVGSWAFSASRGDNQALAELGFIVVAIEGTGNPNRSKSYHDMYFPNMSENTLPDQIASIRQLAKKFPYIDTTRVGIWGHSGGGFATACAMFRYPDFFKVGISESGNHDNRNYEDDWGERYIGLLTKSADGKDNYESQANQVYAKNLKGKLMLAHGLMDDNVPPYNTMLVVDALTRANKDYDLVVFPQAAHGYGPSSLYMTRRRWDYFVKHLLSAEPPKEYKLENKPDPRNAGM